MISILIIADDFTGAIDAGAQFADAGLSTRVVISRSLPAPADCAGVEVLSIDAETRHGNPENAYAVTRSIAKEAIARGIPLLFKKVDSTLRGQLGSELAALSSAAGGGDVAFLPAFPAAGRTTQNGVQLLRGTPIHETAFSNDPFEPVPYTSIGEAIHAQRDIPVHCVRVGELPPPPNGQGRITVYDAATEEDMAQTVERLSTAGTTLWAGCAGLARQLAARMRKGAPKPMPCPADGFFLACGSLNPISHRQILQAQRAGFSRVVLNYEEKLSPGFPGSPAEQRLLELLKRESETTGRVILDVDVADCDPNEPDFGFTRAEARVLVSQRIGRLVKRWMNFGFSHTMMVTGGDTLFALMDSLGVDALTPICELDAGVICSQFQWGGKRWQLVSKAGGYGAEDILPKTAALLMKQASGECGGC